MVVVMMRKGIARGMGVLLVLGSYGKGENSLQCRLRF